MTILEYNRNWWQKGLCWYKVTNVPRTQGSWVKARNQRQAIEVAFDGLPLEGLYFVQAFRYKYDSSNEGPLEDWLFTDTLVPLTPGVSAYKDTLDLYNAHA